MTRRCTRTGSTPGRGGGPAGRRHRSRRTSSLVSGLGRTRSSSREDGSSKNDSVSSSMPPEALHRAGAGEGAGAALARPPG